MSQLAIGAGGAVLGGIAGSLIPGVGVLLGVQLGFLGGAILGGILFPTEVDAGGPSRDDVRLSTTAIGRFIPIVYATVQVAGQYLWVDEPEFRTQKDNVGKGGGTEVKSTKMFLSFACGICEGPIAAITRIWVDEEIIFDIGGDTNPSGPALAQILLESLQSFPEVKAYDGTVQALDVNQFGPIRIYLGTEAQPADVLLQLDDRIGDSVGSPATDSTEVVPPMAGLAYAVFERIPGDVVNNHFPQVKFEVLKAETAVTTAIEYEPTVNREIRLRKDRVNVIGYGNAKIEYWNLIQKESNLFPQVVTLNRDEPAEDTVEPANIGTIDQAVPFIHTGRFNAGLLQHRIYDGQTGAKLDGPVQGGLRATTAVAYQYPNTEFPTYLVYTNILGDIQTLSLPVGTASLAIVADTINWTHPVAALGKVKWGAYGFIGPDNYLHSVVTDASDGESYLVAVDIFTHTLIRSAEVVQGSPNADDPFYGKTELTYDSLQDKIIIHGNGRLRKFDRATYAFEKDAFVNGVGPSAGGWGRAFRNGPVNSRLWLGGTGVLYDMDLVSMTIARQIDDVNVDWNISETDGRHPVFDAYNNGVWMQSFLNTDWLVFVPLDRRNPVCTTTGAIAADLSDLAGVPSTLRDTSKWTDEVCGYLIGRRISARKALEPLAGAFNSDYRTQDGLVDFHKLDTASIKTIAEDDLGASERIEDKVPVLDMAWPSERELPLRVDVAYVDRSLDYQPNTQHDTRAPEATRGRGKRTVQIPIVFDDGVVPKQIAERLLHQIHAKRDRFAVALTLEHLDINVGDAFNFIRGSRTFRARAEKAALTETMRVVVEASSEDITIATASGVAGNLGPELFTSPNLASFAGSQLFLLDIPLLQDLDDGSNQLTIYAAAGPLSETAWPGAGLFKSTDGGLTYPVDVAAFGPGEQVEWGYATTVLAEHTRTIIDRVNTVDIKMVQGTLTSRTNAELDTDRTLNAVAIGRPGRWEIMRFASAVNLGGSPDDEGDTYTVSNLRRGQRGTEAHRSAHLTGDLVIVLNNATLRRVVLPSSDLNVQRHYKLVTSGQLIESAFAQTFALTAEADKPYSPVDINGTRALATGNWTVNWTRRGRIANEWKDLSDIPLGEDTEEYEIEVLSGPGGSVLLTHTGLTSATDTITGAELEGLLGSPAPGDIPFSLTVKIYQISALVGRGTGTEATISSPTPGN